MHFVRNTGDGPRVVYVKVKGAKAKDGKFPSEPVVLQKGEGRNLDLAHDPETHDRLKAYIDTGELSIGEEHVEKAPETVDAKAKPDGDKPHRQRSSNK